MPSSISRSAERDRYRSADRVREWYAAGQKWKAAVEAGKTQRELSREEGKTEKLVSELLVIATLPDRIISRIMGSGRETSKAELLRLAVEVAPCPDETQNMLAEQLLAKAPTRLVNRRERSVREIVWQRYTALKGYPRKGVAGEIVQAVVRYLDGADPRLRLPKVVLR